MRRGASVSQDLAESSGPRGLRIVRALSRRGSALVSGMAALLRKAEPSCIYKLGAGVDGLAGSVPHAAGKHVDDDHAGDDQPEADDRGDRKSTRLNSST